MDAKERHELKDNDLAEFIEHFGEFWDKRGNTIMIIITVVLVAFVGKRYYSNNQAQVHETAWYELEATSTPQGYRERAIESAGIGGVPHLALLRGAEAYHDQAILLEQEAGEEDAGMMSASESLEAAEAMYTQVLESDAAPAFRANAAAGLANVAETHRDFTAAKEHWAKAQQLAEDARLTTLVTQANIRMAMLEDLAKPIVFDESDVTPVVAPESPADAEPQSTDAGEAEATATEAVEKVEASATPTTPGQ